MTYDIIIIGAGHNGLITASRLAAAGKKVLLLERRTQVGGCAVTEEIHPGFRCPSVAHSGGMFQAEIAKELDLPKYGFKTLEFDPLLFAPSPDGEPIQFWKSGEKTGESLSRISKRDSERYPAFQKEMERLAGFMRPLMQNVLPDPAVAGFGNIGELLRLGWKLHKLREKDVQQLMRVLPMPVLDWLNEYFENDHLKGVLSSHGVAGAFYGARSAGSVFLMLYHRTASESPSRDLIQGGIGALTSALAEVAKSRGCEIRSGAEVKQVLIQDGRATGVSLANGDEIKANAVVSNADAKTTFLKLVDPVQLEPHFLMAIRNIRSRGVSAKVNFALDRYPQWKGLQANGPPPVSICIAPGVDYVERAFDDAKYGNYSKEPLLDIFIPSVVDKTVAPEGKHVMSIHVMFAPYHLRNGNWTDLKNKFGDHVTAVVEIYAPGFSKSILNRQVITPLDLEKEFGLYEGNTHHGEMSLDQILFMRPIPGYSRYRTPIRNLFLCGAATHPGGGVTGLPGTLAAREILSDL